VQPYSNPFSNGYCTYSCDVSAQCPLYGGAICASPTGGPDQYCLAGCVSDGQCTALGQLGCRTVTEGADLFGTFRDVAYCASGDNLGAECVTDTDCTSDPAVTELQLKCLDKATTGQQEKICSKSCTKDLDCPYNSLCADGKFCARKCYMDWHCAKPKSVCRYDGYRMEPYYDDLFHCTDAANLGAACAADADCTAGLTCKTGEAYPDGFCTAACTTGTDCNKYGSNLCVDKYCQRGCTEGGSRGRDFICSRHGYTCHQPVSGTGYMCLGYPSVGASCGTDVDCTSGLVCRHGAAYPGGYCSMECTSDSDCAAGGFAFCQSGYCVRNCTTDTDCGRWNYICLAESSGGRKYCSIAPDVGSQCRTSAIGPQDGDCSFSLDCMTGNDWPGNYCTADCAANADCPARSGSVCTSGKCKQTCSSDASCSRTGYTCRSSSDGTTNYLVCLGIPNVGAECQVPADPNADDGCTKSGTYKLSCKSGQTGVAGACTMQCRTAAECPSQSTCVDGYCARSCLLDAECGRTHFFCLKNSSGVVYCSSNPNVGEDCSADSDCYQGLTCQTVSPGKKACTRQCTTPGSGADCFPESNGVCTAGSPVNLCARGCTADADCGRPGVMYCSQGVCTTVPNYDASCSAAADCDPALSCLDVATGVKACSKSCKNDTECKPEGTAKCNTVSGKLCWKSCTRDADCGPQLKCDTNVGHCAAK
jgi:hypothetical protein